MCKSFPPPLVRGGVFLVGLETKYRDIADGNMSPKKAAVLDTCTLESKYRNIADSKQVY